MRFNLPFITPKNLSLHSVKVALVGLALLAGCANAVAQMPSDSKPKRNSDKYTLVHAGTLLAEPGRPPLAQRTIVIRNDEVL